jgi:hypothetical protein
MVPGLCSNYAHQQWQGQQASKQTKNYESINIE